MEKNIYLTTFIYLTTKYFKKIPYLNMCKLDFTNWPLSFRVFNYIGLATCKARLNKQKRK